MEGWRPVEDLVRWGFAHAPVVMANEAHNGLARCVRTREVGIRMVQVAHEAGVWRQAADLGRLVAGDPGEPLLVWCGNGHATKEQCQDWIPMGGTSAPCPGSTRWSSPRTTR